MQGQLESSRRLDPKNIVDIIPQNQNYYKNLLRFRLITIQTIAVICSLISFIYGWAELQKSKYQIGTILMIITFVINSVCFLIMFKIVFNKKVYHFLNVLINFLLIISFFTAAASSVLLMWTYFSNSQNSTQSTKPDICPSYTRNSTTISNQTNITACFCNSMMGTTMLGYQTTGIQCCDCPLDIDCKDFDNSVCKVVNKVSFSEISVIIICGILAFSSGNLQLITFIFLFH